MFCFFHEAEDVLDYTPYDLSYDLDVTFEEAENIFTKIKNQFFHTDQGENEKIPYFAHNFIMKSGKEISKETETRHILTNCKAVDRMLGGGELLYFLVVVFHATRVCQFFVKLNWLFVFET
jgi:hypothetical protein